MANSTSANLYLTVQATGENSGTWGQITNTNLLILEQAIGGYEAVALNTTTGATLVFSNGVLSNGKNQVIKLTGNITSNVDVIVPNDATSGIPPQKTYIVENAAVGAFTVTFKTQSGTGITWSATDKGKKILYSDGTNILEGISSTGNLEVSGNLDVDGGTIKLDGNYPTGTDNVALGNQALEAVEAGASSNTAVGNKALENVTTGDNNIGVGHRTLCTLTTGSCNVAVGKDALRTNTGDSNVAIGQEALVLNESASNNTAVGALALTANTTGCQNTAVGNLSLAANTTGINNTAIGHASLCENTTGCQNTAVGRSSL
jgi:hypothetical protein